MGRYGNEVMLSRFAVPDAIGPPPRVSADHELIGISFEYSGTEKNCDVELLADGEPHGGPSYACTWEQEKSLILLVEPSR